MPLEPEQLTPAASLNRMPLRLPDIPAARAASDVLSLPALAQALRCEAAELGLAAAYPDAQLPWLLDACLGSSEVSVRKAAERSVTVLGLALGQLVLTLGRGDANSRAARPDWDSSYWEHWAGMRRIVVGGGLAGGRLGPAIVKRAGVVVDSGGGACTLEVAEHPAVLPLIGAARSAPAGHAAALVCDFGSTTIKRARADYAAGRLRALALEPPLPALGALEPAAHARAIAELLADAWATHAATHALAPVIVCAIACYTSAGAPLPRQGSAYAALGAVSPNLSRWLAAEVSGRLGREVEIRLVHDGTAAARTYAGTPGTAVITLGTALGVGFAGADADYRPIEPGLTVAPSAGNA